ncbi:MAG: Stf0 family sulfotransferase [Pseudomonadota bacterium]
MPPDGPYDLTLASADFPPWDGPPRRSIVVCSHPRSGSTLLGEAMTFAGGLGCPLEYLHRGFRPAFERRWETSDALSYRAALHRLRTGPNGVFSIKLFWQDIEDVALELAPDRSSPVGMPGDTTPDAYRSLFDLLSAFLPNPEFVYLERADRVRQAVSAMVAAQSGLWRSIEGVGRPAPQGAAVYDYDRVLANIALGDYSREHWRGFFAANAIRPRFVTYEDLDARYARTVGALLAELGAEDATPPPRRMRRQGDTSSEAIVLDFLREHAGREAGG